MAKRRNRNRNNNLNYTVIFVLLVVGAGIYLFFNKERFFKETETSSIDLVDKENKEIIASDVSYINPNDQTLGCYGVGELFNNTFLRKADCLTGETIPYDENPSGKATLREEADGSCTRIGFDGHRLPADCDTQDWILRE